MREAGESRWAPWGLLFATRLAFAFVLIVVGGLDLFPGIMASIFPTSSIDYGLARKFFRALTFLATGLTYTLLAGCTMIVACGRRAAKGVLYPSFAVFMMGLTAPFSWYMIAEFVEAIVIRGVFGWEMLRLLLPLFAYSVDVLLMQSKVRLRFRYAFYSFLLYVLYNVLWHIHTVHSFELGTTIAVAFGFAGAMLLAAIIAIGITRVRK